MLYNLSDNPLFSYLPKLGTLVYIAVNTVTKLEWCLFFLRCNGMCKSKYICCVVFPSLEPRENVCRAFSVLCRPTCLCEPICQPPSLERVPVMVANCSLCPLLVILELSTDSVAFIMNNVCDLTILPQFSKQVL